MCGFMVYTKKDISKEELEKEFKKIKHRGPDMNRKRFKYVSFS